MDLDGPALTPPKGVTSNFTNPPNNNALAIGVLTTCAAVATICLFLRLYGRVYLLRKCQAEEIMVTLAYGSFWGAIWSTFAMVKTPGYFVHQWNVRLREITPTQYYVLVFGVCYSFVLPLLKVTMMVEWCRMFVPRGNKKKGYFWWGAMAICFVQIGAGVATVIALNLQCIPHKAIYDITVTGQCFKLYNLQVASASIQLGTDVAIFLLPQPVIWKLQLSWQKKAGLAVIFGLGLLACFSATFRLITTVTHGEAKDSIYTLGPLVFWATAEMTCGFFIVCMPCMPKILKDTGVIRNVKRAFGMKTTTTKSGSNMDRYGAGLSSRGKMPSAVTKDYYELREEAASMHNSKGTESTEHLHDSTREGLGITRTTRITVMEDARSASETGSGRYAVPKDAWC